MTGGINMASNDLIIDDDYCKSMQTYFMIQGEQLDKLISDYVVILKGINSNAIAANFFHFYSYLCYSGYY